jgi:phosphoglycolate phosphatase-like HAD superfamily hydrolase
MTKPRIALDADGVLLDFHLGYASAWQRAFGHFPAERDPLAYWPIDRWHVPRLDLAGRARFRSAFDQEFWASLPPIAGALQACHQLNEAGFELVCVSAIDKEFEDARLQNLQDLGFPIQRVIATGHSTGDRSPKADAIESLAPVAFVDDFLPYMRGLPTSVHTALILRGPNGSPNTADEASIIRSRHSDLAEFAIHWLER